MKRWSILFSILLVFILVTPVLAERNFLIDFNNLENTELDIVKIAGPNAFQSVKTDEERKNLLISLEPKNWEVQLSPSSRTIENITNSYVQTVKVTRGQYAGQTVLGARIHFPTEKYNAWAKVIPPYEIPSYEPSNDQDAVGNKYLGKGVLRNVGAIEYLIVTVRGVNFPHSLTIRLKNQNDEYIDFFVGYLDFAGFITITIDNPNYISDVRKRMLKKYPLYPVEEPYIKLDSFIVYRHGDQIGGDFLLYVKSIEMIYDLAILKQEQEIDDEEIWHILRDRREAKKRAEAARVGIIQLLRWEEQQKMATESSTEQPATK